MTRENAAVAAVAPAHGPQRPTRGAKVPEPACGPPRGRESVQDKARRYLAEGRVRILRVDAETVEAVVAGSGAYRVQHDGRHGWRCSCPATRRCSHLTAVRLVTEGAS